MSPKMVDLQDVVFYAYRYDDKPSQFWNCMWRLATQLGYSVEAKEFANWRDKGVV